MKNFLLGIVMVFTCFDSSAQSKNLKLSFGGELGVVTGDIDYAYSFQVGGNIQADLKITNDISITAQAGLVSLKGKEISGTNLRFQSTTLIPLLGGVQYFFTQRLYGSGQLGVSFSTDNGGGSAFTYAPGVGWKITDKLDALLKYTGYENGGTVGVRVGYAFK